jgi:hypothetical protein
MDWKCNLKQALEFLIPLFAFAAAIFWFASAGVGFRLFERYLKWQASSFNRLTSPVYLSPSHPMKSPT